MFRNISSPLARLARILKTLRGGIALMLAVVACGAAVHIADEILKAGDTDSFG